MNDWLSSNIREKLIEIKNYSKTKSRLVSIRWRSRKHLPEKPIFSEKNPDFSPPPAATSATTISEIPSSNNFQLPDSLHRFHA